VADDDGVTRRLLTMLLERQGFRVMVAEDGQAALRQVRTGKPRIVFLDASMPTLDGYEVCRRIRQDAPDPEPTVIMLTAGGQDSDRLRAAAAGVNEFLTKPFSPSKLAARLQQLRLESPE
jgi:two-component system, OmpR family, response regulator ResD